MAAQREGQEADPQLVRCVLAQPQPLPVGAKGVRVQRPSRRGPCWCQCRRRRLASGPARLLLAALVLADLVAGAGPALGRGCGLACPRRCQHRLVLQRHHEVAVCGRRRAEFSAAGQLEQEHNQWQPATACSRTKHAHHLSPLDQISLGQLTARRAS
jgi:hypothetical protein